jgi:glycosyltransferase involved in cell wall biosynthesis
MTRIAHVVSTPAGIGGAERIVAALVVRGGELGWRQELLNPFALDPEHAAIADACSPAAYAGFRCTNVRDLLGTRRWLHSQLDTSRPAIVHVHLFHAEVLTASIRRPPGNQLVLTHHHAGHLHALGRRRDEALDFLAVRRFDRVVAISEWARRFLRERFRFPESKLTSIPNGWDGEPDTSVPQAKEPTVICVANFRREKSHETLIAAFARVIRELPDARLMLVGSGGLEREIASVVDVMGLSRHVEFAGPAPSVWPYLARAHVFVLPSRHEPLGIAVMEAMAAGLPVVATAVGGIPELVIPGVTGALVAPGDEVAMAGELLRLLRDAPLREMMGAAGRNAVASRTMEKTVDRYFDLYERLVCGRERGEQLYTGVRR